MGFGMGLAGFRQKILSTSERKPCCYRRTAYNECRKYVFHLYGKTKPCIEAAKCKLHLQVEAELWNLICALLKLLRASARASLQQGAPLGWSIFLHTCQ